MIRLIIGFVTGYTFAKITGHTEFEKKIKNIFHKCKDAVKEEFGKEEATETSCLKLGVKMDRSDHQRIITDRILYANFNCSSSA